MIRFLLSVHSVKFRFGSGPIWFLSINQVPIEICSENNRFSCSAKICIMHIKRINFELIKILNQDWSLIDMSDNYPLMRVQVRGPRTGVLGVSILLNHFQYYNRPQLKLTFGPGSTELWTRSLFARLNNIFPQNSEQREQRLGAKFEK